MARKINRKKTKKTTPKKRKPATRKAKTKAKRNGTVTTTTRTTTVKKTKKNPGLAQATRLAARRFAGFHGETPSESVRVKLPPAPKAMYTLGELEAVTYNAVVDGEHARYIHRFKKKSRPLLAVSSDGKQLYLIGGSYSITDRGIVDA